MYRTPVMSPPFFVIGLGCNPGSYDDIIGFSRIRATPRLIMTEIDL